MLWKNKSSFHIYQIHDSFLERCITILTGEVSDRVTQETKDFLEGKDLLFLEEEHSYLRLYGFEGTPFLLLKFVIDQLFNTNLCRQYLYCSSFFEQKHKRQFILISFLVANLHVKNITHLKEVGKDYELCEFIQGLEVRGFEPFCGSLQLSWG